MKTNEFVKRVKCLGFQVQLEIDYIYIKDSRGVRVAIISRTKELRMDTDLWGSDIRIYIRGKILFNLIVEYAKTPVDEREEEKFYFEHKLLKSRKGKPVYLALKCKRGKEFLTVQGSKEDIDNNKVHFTREEIESIKERFDTDLAEFEEIEVKDE